LDEIVFLKLGGSLLTDKRHQNSARTAVITRLAGEVAAALAQRPALRLLLGHGSGSFGHYPAALYGVRAGNLRDWFGYAATSDAAQALNRLVVSALVAAGVPAVAVQPSATARCRQGQLIELDHTVAQILLERGCVPVVYGDVALDEAIGCTIISTEQVFSYLAGVFNPQHILLAGEVAGVYQTDPHLDANAALLPELTFAEFQHLAGGIGGAGSVDVTGGMASKVQLMFGLLSSGLAGTVTIMGAMEAGTLERALLDPANAAGTMLHI